MEGKSRFAGAMRLIADYCGNYAAGEVIDK